MSGLRITVGVTVGFTFAMFAEVSAESITIDGRLKPVTEGNAMADDLIFEIVAVMEGRRGIRTLL